MLEEWWSGEVTEETTHRLPFNAINANQESIELAALNCCDTLPQRAAVALSVLEYSTSNSSPEIN